MSKMTTLRVHRTVFALIVFTAAHLVTVNADIEGCLEVVPSLQYSCSRRNLSYIPPSIPPSTQHLDFSFNYLTILQRHILWSLPSLEYLDLTRCHIQHIDNDAFFNLRNLSVLILTGNPVKYFGRSSINVLEKLQKLVLVDIGLISLDSLNLQNLTSLKELNFGTNRLFSLSLPNYAVGFKNFKLLDLHTNNISVIRAVHTSVLRQMGNNITLVLSRNPIAFIETGAFTRLNLGELNLLDTFTSSSRVITGGLTGLNVKKLKIGNFKEMGRTQAYADSLDSLCFIHFQEIFFHQSFCSTLPSHILDCMRNCTKIFLYRAEIVEREHFYFPNLKEMFVVQGKLEKIPYQLLSHQHNLQRLVISNNHKPPDFHSSVVDLPSLEYVDLSCNNLIMSCCDIEFIGTPKLRYLNLSLNAKVKIRGIGLSYHSSLEVLDLHGTEVEAEYDMPVLQNLINLKILDLSHSQFNFKHTDIFYGLSSLKELKIAGSSFARGIFSKIFVNLTALEVLDISDCGINDIPWTSFQNLHHLKYLALSGNRLSTVDFLTGLSLSKLKYLHADRNQIATISPKLLQNLPTDILLFDLSFNPVECSCSQAGFISWIIDHQSVLKDPQLMSCKSSSVNSRVTDFDLTHCVHMRRVKTIMSMLAVVIFCLCSALVYKYQFYLQYCCILLRGYRIPTQQEYSYDAFVIYSSKDETWVFNELKEKLEKGVPPIHLCLHERDFEPGKSITSSIVEDGIMGSRRVIVVVSRNFLASSWCRFEFELAQSWLVLRRSASIIIIILEDVENRSIKRMLQLHKYLKKNTYLKWKRNALGNVRFWARLRKAIIANK